MKIVTVLTVVMAVAFTANTAPVDNVVSSALIPGDSVVYNLDFIDPFGLPIFDVMVKSRMGNTEHTTMMDHVGTPPHYLNTYEGVETYSSPSGEIEFYGRVEADTLLITQSYKNEGNQFPPNSILYADLADDPVGDTLPGTSGEWLDITGSAITYSDDSIYVRLNNAGGGWPTSQGFDFFAYGFILYNPGSSDLSATALVYVDVPFFYSPGLYSVNLVDTLGIVRNCYWANLRGQSAYVLRHIRSIAGSQLEPVAPGVGVYPHRWHNIICGFAAAEFERFHLSVGVYSQDAVPEYGSEYSAYGRCFWNGSDL